MSALTTPLPALFFVSSLYRSDLISIDDIKAIFPKELGEIRTFTHSFFPMKKYYEKEMGAPLERVIYFFSNIKEREFLVDFKIFCVEQEELLSKEKKRYVNLDPGLISLENMQLATGKMYAHRIYLGRGVYSDLHYIFKSGQFHPTEWCYPDYANEDYLTHFAKERLFLHKLIKEKALI